MLSGSCVSCPHMACAPSLLSPTPPPIPSTPKPPPSPAPSLAVYPPSRPTLPTGRLPRLHLLHPQASAPLSSRSCNLALSSCKHSQLLCPSTWLCLSRGVSSVPCIFSGDCSCRSHSPAISGGCSTSRPIICSYPYSYMPCGMGASSWDRISACEIIFRPLSSSRPPLPHVSARPISMPRALVSRPRLSFRFGLACDCLGWGRAEQFVLQEAC